MFNISAIRTPGDSFLIGSGENAPAVAQGLGILDNARLLTPENRSAFIESGENGRENVWKVAAVINVLLDNAYLFTRENRTAS